MTTMLLLVSVFNFDFFFSILKLPVFEFCQVSIQIGFIWRYFAILAFFARLAIFMIYELETLQ